MYQIFISMYLKANIQNLVKNDPVVSKKDKFKFNDLRPRARNDLELKYLLSFTESTNFQATGCNSF